MNQEGLSVFSGISFMTSIGLPIGFRDVLFEEVKERRAVEDTLAALLKQRGFREIIPSSVEFKEFGEDPLAAGLSSQQNRDEDPHHENQSAHCPA